MGKTKKQQLLGRYIVADPEICHGEPTFRGTRIMVWQVLEMVAEGKADENVSRIQRQLLQDWRIPIAEGGANMLVSVQGVYRQGKIELIEQPSMIRDETRVVVTFLESGLIDLRTRGMNEKQAAELRARLATFAEDWDSPEMSIYDNYDAAKAKL